MDETETHTQTGAAPRKSERLGEAVENVVRIGSDVIARLASHSDDGERPNPEGLRPQMFWSLNEPIEKFHWRGPFRRVGGERLGERGTTGIYRSCG